MARQGQVEGWHREDIKAAVRKKGRSLTQLAQDAGLYASACRLAMTQPQFEGEQAIARFIGVPAHKLWPERYDPDGTPKHPRARKEHIASARSHHRQNRRRA